MSHNKKSEVHNPLLPKEETEGKEKSLKDKIIDALCDVYDPEIPVSIWELGLIYDLDVDESKNVHICMTLTSPACPVAGMLAKQVERQVQEIPGIGNVKVELVWDPPWNKDMMSEEAKLQLGFL